MGRKRTQRAQEHVPVPGWVKPTEREVMREEVGRTEDWLFPDNRNPEANPAPDVPGDLICPRCHAISREKRWFLDEPLYETLKRDPSTRAVVCPGCEAIEREMYDGEVVLRSHLLAANKETALSLIHNEEARVRQDNPLARLASVQDRGDEIYVLTITPFLARRIGREFEKAYGGKLEVQKLPQERFTRVRWTRE